MKYSFTIYYITTETDETIAECLYKHSCDFIDDVLCGVDTGKYYLDFELEAPSINEAIKSAIDYIISSGLDIKITSIQVDNSWFLSSEET